jgi:predicted ATPase
MHLKKIHLRTAQFPTNQHYPFNLEVLRQTEFLEFDRPVCLLIGENGSGKSTLLKAIARVCDIHIWQEQSFFRRNSNPFEELLYQYLEPQWSNQTVPGSYFDSALFHDFARMVDEWAYSDPSQLRHFGGRSLTTQSHGQSLISFFKARYQLRGLYLVDEPETALSPKSQLEFLNMLAAAARFGNAQFIIATHSPILMATPGAKIFSFDHTPLRILSYEDTAHYQLYRQFLQNPQGFIQSDEQENALHLLPGD